MGPRFRKSVVQAAVACSLLACTAPAAGAAATKDVTIDVASNRADLLSGGDALVAISLPAGRKTADLKVTLAGRDVTAQFAKRADGRFGALLTGIPNGRSNLKAVLPDGSGAVIVLTGHPQGGPVISGPQLQPWICQPGALDAQCNQPATYAYFADDGSKLSPIEDPKNPPAGTATTTTDQGVQVPFVVRVETGYQDRDEYKIATLYDASKPWDAWAPQKQWNRKVVITHGGSCSQDRKTGGSPDVLNREVLGKGFIVMSTALNNLGHNCNPVIIAESEMMEREHVVEAYGPVERTLGTGCSGGSIAQIMTAHAYPGFYDGITIQCTFADLFTTGKQAVGGHLLQGYLKANPTFAADYPAFGGSPLAATDDALFDAAFWNSINGTDGCKGLEPSQKWSPSNTGGVRCGTLDHNVNVLGKGPSGYAAVPLDDVGVQFGYKALVAGRITAGTFVEVNSKIGGIDKTTYLAQPERTAADPEALTNSYRSGYVAIGNTLDQTPILEGRGPNETTAHVTYPSLALNARLDRQFGTHASHALWQGPSPLIGDASFANRMVFAMDRWVAAIQKDTSARSTGDKVRANRPTDITDHCEAGGVETPGTDCPAISRFYESPTNVAGESIRGDILKCQLKPLDRGSYGSATFTDAQWATMQATFPDGVCDYSKPGVGETKTIPWLTYANKAGGEELGAAPRSVAILGRRSVVTLRTARAALTRLRKSKTATVVLTKAKGTRSATKVRVEVRDSRNRIVARSRSRTVYREQTTVLLTRVRALGKGAVRVRVLASDARGALPVRVLSVRFF